MVETFDDSLFFLRQMSQARCTLRFFDPWGVSEGPPSSISSSLEDIAKCRVQAIALSNYTVGATRWCHQNFAKSYEKFPYQAETYDKNLHSFCNSIVPWLTSAAFSLLSSWAASAITYTTTAISSRLKMTYRGTQRCRDTTSWNGKVMVRHVTNRDAFRRVH